MSVPAEQTIDEPLEGESGEAQAIPLSQFVADFGEGLLEAVQRQNPPLYDGESDPKRTAAMEALKREPFPAQAEVVQAVTRALYDAGEPAAVINAEMGTGKTIMAIAVAAIAHAEGHRRTLVLSPPHLVYKWRREIVETVPGARVWVLNGPDTLRTLLRLRAALCGGEGEPTGPEFFILGRVRMRMGFHWRPAFAVRRFHRRVPVDAHDPDGPTVLRSCRYAACSSCGEVVCDSDGEPLSPETFNSERRQRCTGCGETLWTLIHPRKRGRKSRREQVIDGLCQIPTIGPKTAGKLVATFGDRALEGMLADNVHELINLMDGDGELVFSDRQAARMERALANLELGFGQGGYQPTEFIKRYLPDKYFDLLVVDEGHEYKADGSAQGQAMGVLCSKVSKALLLTGTLIGGYADDLFHLLWRLMPRHMIGDGYTANARGSLGPAAMAFMRGHGVLKDIYKESEAGDHRTARGTRITVHTSKAPGFGPGGIARYVLPYTAFLKLGEIGGNVLPDYNEHFHEIAMEATQAQKYQGMASVLRSELKQALARGDKTLLGVVLQVLLAWPDTCFREEAVKHPRTRALVHYTASVFGDAEVSPKEAALVDLCRKEKARGRRVLVYTTYTGTRDTTARLKGMLAAEGFKAAVLRASVDTAKREDWIAEQVDRGIDALICNPELVKTGLDLLDFPTMAFMQSGYSVYTLQQASRRSWRIGQTQPVDVHFFGYAETAQMTCLSLMASKIAVAQSTAGEMPDSGLDVLNSEGDSIEVALAKQLAA